MKEEYAKLEVICPKMGSEEYHKMVYNKDYTAEEMMYVIQGLESENIVVPFACVYNVAILSAKRKREKQFYDNSNEYADVNQYFSLAKQSPKGELEYLRDKRFELVGKLSHIGKLWLRRYELCDYVDDGFVNELTKVYQSLILNKENVMAFFNSLIDFHTECNAIEKLDKKIAELKSSQQKEGKFLYFKTILSDKQLIAIRNVLVDCKGGNYGNDKNYLAPISDDDWLYIFGRKALVNANPPRWLSSNQFLMNVMQFICGEGSVLKPIVKKHFEIENPPKADKRVTPVALQNKLDSIIPQ